MLALGLALPVVAQSLGLAHAIYLVVRGRLKLIHSLRVSGCLIVQEDRSGDHAGAGDSDYGGDDPVSALAGNC